LLASSAFPGLFSPVCIDDVLYADGGILDNFPIDPIQSEVDWLIGSYVSPLDAIQADSLKYSINVLERAIRINYSKRSRRKFDACDILIQPPKLVEYGLFDVNKLEDIYQIGYEAARAKLQNEVKTWAKSQ
jgi:NTE family protein